MTKTCIKPEAIRAQCIRKFGTEVPLLEFGNALLELPFPQLLPAKSLTAGFNDCVTRRALIRHHKMNSKQLTCLSINM